MPPVNPGILGVWPGEQGSICENVGNIWPERALYFVRIGMRRVFASREESTSEKWVYRS